MTPKAAGVSKTKKHIFQKILFSLPLLEEIAVNVVHRRMESTYLRPTSTESYKSARFYRASLLIITLQDLSSWNVKLLSKATTFLFNDPGCAILTADESLPRKEPHCTVHPLKEPILKVSPPQHNPPPDPATDVHSAVAAAAPPPAQEPDRPSLGSCCITKQTHSTQSAIVCLLARKDRHHLRCQVLDYLVFMPA